MVSNNFMEIWRGGGESLNMEILGEGGLKQFRISGGRRGQKTVPSIGGRGCGFFLE